MGGNATVQSFAGASSRPSPLFASPLRIDDMEGMVTSKGYQLEKHEVITSDGYKLGTFRIPKIGPPVLLLHGISLASTCWVLNQPTESLAFILSDAGYDVWMMNTRGNTFSRAHKKLKDTQSAFWAFSLDQFALYDLPNTVDYVLANTGYKSLSLVGHSQAGSIALAALAYTPSLGQKFNVVILMAPCVYVQFMTSPVLTSYSRQAAAAPIMYLAPPSELYWMSPTIQATYLGGYCQVLAAYPQCLAALQGMFGVSSHITASQYIRNWNTWPSSTSNWNGLQWAQIFNTGPESPVFRMWNYGAIYDLTKVTAKVIIFSGGRDVLASPQDVALVKKNLKTAGSLVGEYIVSDYSHMDWIWDTNAKNRIYPAIMRGLRRFTGNGGAAAAADSAESTDLTSSDSTLGGTLNRVFNLLG